MRACARARTAHRHARRLARLSCCLYPGPDARRRPSSSTTTHRIVMRDRDTRRVFPPRGKPSRGRLERRHARTRPADVLSRCSPARALLRALLAPPPSFSRAYALSFPLTRSTLSRTRASEASSLFFRRTLPVFFSSFCLSVLPRATFCNDAIVVN